MIAYATKIDALLHLHTNQVYSQMIRINSQIQTNAYRALIRIRSVTRIPRHIIYHVCLLLDGLINIRMISLYAH